MTSIRQEVEEVTASILDIPERCESFTESEKKLIAAVLYTTGVKLDDGEFARTCTPRDPSVIKGY